MHPKWSLKTLQKQGSSKLKSKSALYQWKEDVKQGGTTVDKWKHIEVQTFECFLDAREHLEQVILKNINIIELEKFQKYKLTLVLR